MTNQNNEKSKNGKRLALILIAILLLVAIAFGAYTYSRYVTQDSGRGSANVARWGFSLNVTSEAETTVSEDGDPFFAQSYENDGEAGTSNTIAVAQSNRGNIVAPGTKGNAVFTVSGTAEVNAQISMAISEISSDIYLTLVDADATGTTIEYHPVRFTLSQYSSGNWTALDGFSNLSVEEMQTMLTGEKATKIEVAANASATAYNFKLEWQWSFEPDTFVILNGETPVHFTKLEVNKLDTMLAQWSASLDGRAETITVTDTTSNKWTVTPSQDGGNWSDDIGFTVGVTIEQINTVVS